MTILNILQYYGYPVQCSHDICKQKMLWGGVFDLQKKELAVGGLGDLIDNGLLETKIQFTRGEGHQNKKYQGKGGDSEIFSPPPS